MPATVEVRPTIDRPWLERVAAEEPLVHAYALWDLDRAPRQVRFLSAVRGEETLGYLLVWLGRKDGPVVHWFGPAELAGALVPAFPAPPFTAVVPLEVEPAVVSAFPGARAARLRMLLRPPGASPAGGGSAVRRLGRAHRAALAGLARAYATTELAAYAGLDPETEPAWGAFEGDSLVGVARAAVRLAGIWVVGGVFVEPASRGRGLGLALVGAVVAEAERSGARTGLYARDDARAANRLYERLGFREVGRRSWLDVRGEGVVRGPRDPAS